MSNLANVVQQLQKEREQARRTVEQLDEALKALGSLDGLRGVGRVGRAQTDGKTRSGSLFAFAGLWDRWRDPKNNILETCTILTTQPNSLVADVHDRMPAILRVEDYEGWLDPGIADAKAVLYCLKPFDAGLMKKYPVSSRVNRPENDDEECAREVSIESAPMTLF